jgi:pimeloyl-ACP methyl ester carboxylesterase
MTTNLLRFALRIGMIAARSTHLPCRLIFSSACLVVLCSCATAPIWFANNSIRPEIPPEITFNKGAGRGELLLLPLRLEDGEEILMMVDTGAPCSVLDTTLVPKLGKRLGTTKIRWVDRKTPGGVYRAPKLYLHNTPLSTPSRMVASDMPFGTPLRGPVQGVLGIDCLRRYCIQLDFAQSKMRFLDPDTLPTEGLGEPFPLKIWFWNVLTPGNLAGAKGQKSRIDTGCNFDGTLKPKLFQRKLREQTPATNDTRHFATGVWNNTIYTNMAINEYGGFGVQNLLGLRFLARHTVTFNFPKRVMYLQRHSTGPLEPDASDVGYFSQLDCTKGWWDADADQPLADRIIGAPNLRPGTNDAFTRILWWDPPRFIPVGPPQANLRITQLLPGDYGVKIGSRAERKPDGGHGLKFDFDFGKGKVSLASQRGTIFLLHDYNQQKEHMILWAWVLAKEGYRIILLDLRGHGDSSGETFSYGKYETADLQQALDYLAVRNICDGPVGVLGLGYGATLALHWAGRDPRIRTVVAIAPHNQLEQAFERTAREMKATVPAAELQEALAQVAARLDIQWPDWSGEAAMRKLKRPVLLIGGGTDTVVSTNDLRVLEQAAPHGSKALVVRDADHGSVKYWFHEIEEPIKAWLHDHLTRPLEQQN